MAKRIIIRTIRRRDGRIYASAIVESESRPGTFYETHVIIAREPVGGVRAVRIIGYCTCPGFQYGYACKHIMWLANKIVRNRERLIKPN